MYDPGIGRWLSEDPIGFKGGDTNLYRYVKNEPLEHTDPSGLQIALGIGVGGLTAGEAAGLFSAAAVLTWLTAGGPVPRISLPPVDWNSFVDPPMTTHPLRIPLEPRALTQPAPRTHAPSNLPEPFREIEGLLRTGRHSQPNRLPDFLLRQLEDCAPAQPATGIRLNGPIIFQNSAPARRVEINPNRGWEAGAALTEEEAIAEVAAGGDVIAASRDIARRIAERAGNGAPIQDPPHGPGQRPHFHPTRNGQRMPGAGHVLY